MDVLTFLIHVSTITSFTLKCEGNPFSAIKPPSLKVPADIRKPSLFSPLSNDDIKSLKLKVIEKVTKSFTDSCLESCKVTKGCVRAVHCLSFSSCKAEEFCVDLHVGSGICYLMATEDAEGRQLESKTPCKISKSEFLENSAPDVFITAESEEHEEVQSKEISSFHASHFKDVKLPGSLRSSGSKLPVITTQMEVPKSCLLEPSYLNQGAVRKQKTHTPGYPVVIEYECGRLGEETYKFVTGTTEAMCDVNGKWTLPALICIPTNCYLHMVSMQGKKRAWYAGDVKKTKNGKECLDWTASLPVGQRFRYQRYTLYPGETSMTEVGNKCRDFVDGEPWCYTTDSETKFEFCSVPQCDQAVPCSLPPYLPGARPVRTETEGDVVNVIYTCQDQLTYHSGSSIASCNTNTGHWTRPDMFCYSTECYYLDSLKPGKAIYMGHVTSTKSGKTCQRFDSQTPHDHEDNEEVSDFRKEKSLDDIGNKCRDGDGEGAPWCYTTDPDTRWEFCDIPECKFNR